MNQYTIKELSEMFQLPASTLRYYEDEGILTNISRSSSGQRIYTDMHVNRLKTICCFKNTGMSIAQLKTFFSYETREEDHIDDILALLKEQQESVAKQINQLKKDYIHVLRKLEYYTAKKVSIENHTPQPDWKEFKFKDIESDI